MGPVIGGALIGAGASLLGNLFGAKNDSSNIDKYNQGQMELAQYQNQFNLEQWNRQNEYNSPEKQVERIRAAGLNPNLIFGSSAMSGNSSSSVTASTPNLKAYTGNQGAFQAVGQGVGNLVGIAVQNKKVDSEIKKNDAQRNLIASQTARNLQETARSEFDLKLANDLRENTLALSNEQLNQARVETALKLDKHTLYGQQFDINNAQLRSIEASTAYTNARTETEKQNVALTAARIMQTYNEMALNDARRANIEAQTETENTTRYWKKQNLMYGSFKTEQDYMYGARLLEARIRQCNSLTELNEIESNWRDAKNFTSILHDLVRTSSDAAKGALYFGF